ncbi:hypothetical protein SPLC1_S370490 [Arthrospira platensis C1]|nr:hypothetical protein SPLC1_S370490 [Arthrospira platensis C1]
MSKVIGIGRMDWYSDVAKESDRSYSGWLRYIWQ